MNSILLASAVPTFLMISFTPGMCMTLSLTLGISIGVRRTLWMMLGELIGVALVASLTLAGVATLLLRYPALFWGFKLVGGAYLAWLGIQLWRSRGRLALPESVGHSDVAALIPRRELALQGFLTAVANPKGWAFFAVLLPPFIDQNQSLWPQVPVLLLLLLLVEWLALVAYALGGRSLFHLLRKAENVRLINRLTGTLMIALGAWLVLA